MTTLNEMIEIIKAENPQGLRTGTDEIGYTDLSPIEYEAQIAEWAKNRLAKQAKTAADLAEAEAVATAKAEAATKLIALGIDPKALGL
jgi:hypothetical protein